MPVPDKYGTIHDDIQKLKLSLIRQFRVKFHELYGREALKFRILSMPGKTFRCYRKAYSVLINKTGSMYKWAVNNHQIYGFENNRETYKVMQNAIEQRNYHIIPIHGDITDSVFWKTINPNGIDIDFCDSLKRSIFLKLRNNITELIMKDSKFILFLNYSCRDGNTKVEEKIDESEIETFFTEYGFEWGRFPSIESDKKAYRSLGPMRLYWAMKLWSKEIADMDKKRQLAAKKAWRTIRANKEKKSASNASRKAWIVRKKRYGPTGTPK